MRTTFEAKSERWRRHFTKILNIVLMNLIMSETETTKTWLADLPPEEGSWET